MRIAPIGGIFAVILFVGPAVAASLSGAEITALVSGKSAAWKAANGKVSGTISWKSNGTQSITGNFEGFSKDSGSWTVKGNKLCSKWKRIRNGAERCDSIVPMGGKTYQAGTSIITLK